MNSLPSVVVILYLSLRTSCDAFYQSGSSFLHISPTMMTLDIASRCTDNRNWWCNRKSSFINPTRIIKLYSFQKDSEYSSGGHNHRDETLPKVKRKRSTQQPSQLEMTTLSSNAAVPYTTKIGRSKDLFASTIGINIFQQFTPSYAKDDFSSLPISNDVTSNHEFSHDLLITSSLSNSKENQLSSSSNFIALNTNIMCLLSDDEGEEDLDVPDTSKEAANQIADKSIYSRISDEAKAKASRAVQKKENPTKKGSRIVVTSVSETLVGNQDDDKQVWDMEKNREEEDDVVNDEPIEEIMDSKRKIKLRKTKVTATVQETGMDTMSSYVKSLGQHQLLSKDSEILLGRQIQILLKWEEIRQSLEKNLSVPPTFGQWADTLKITVSDLKKQIRKSQRAKAALMEANLRLVVTVARQSVKQGRSEINFQDACQEGIIGLTKACEKFDPERGFRFSTYAIWWIKREIHRSITDQGRSIRLPTKVMQKINEIRINERLLMNSLGRKPTDEEVAQKSSLDVGKLLFYRKVAQDAISLDKKIVARVGKGSNSSGGEENGKTIESMVKDSSPTPADLVNKDMLRDDVRKLIKTLSPREQVVIRLRFGLDDGTPKTLDYIGKKFSVETDQIRKIEARALLKLRQPYRNQIVRCYEPDL